MKYILPVVVSVGLLQATSFAGNTDRAIRDTCPLEHTFAVHPHHTSYNALLENYQKTSGVPGAILAVKKERSPLWVGAVGQANIGANYSVQVCTPFRTGSISKVFVAAAALVLKEQGKLKLDDPITVYLPELKGLLPQAESITTRLLLNHSNGIIDPKNDDPVYVQHITNDPAKMDSLSVAQRLQQYVYSKPLLFTPGTKSHYSNSGYWLVGAIIERVTGQTMQQALQELLFTPLGLKHTYYEERENKQLAHGYFMKDGSLVDVTKWDKADGDGDPSSGIISTAADLVTFGEALFTGKLFTAASLKEMLRTTSLKGCPKRQCEYALGLETWDIGKEKGFGKNGSSIGYEANWIYLPEKQTTIVLFANKGGGSDKRFFKKLLE
jgi:D-alanyl-D-alanine carboxypeptidase